MSVDPLDVVYLKLQEASDHLDKAGKALIHPRHRPDARHYAHLFSCQNTIIHHPWHPNFTMHLNAFLGATRSAPDMVLHRAGYDDPKKNPWLLAVDEGEKKRRKRFHRKFEKRFSVFRELPLNTERNEVHHRSGMARWEVVVKGMYGTYQGGPDKPLPSAETPFINAGDDPALQWAAAEAPVLPIVPSWQDFWWRVPQPDGTEKRLPLVDECKKFLAAARELADYGRQLFQAIHAGHKFTPPPR
jgi:hypothetical protein